MLCCFTGKIPFPFTFTLINQLSVSGLSRLICNLYFAALCAKTPAWMLSLSGVVEVNYQHWVRLPAALWRESWKGRLREDIIKQPHSISIKSLFKPQMLICMVDKNFQVFLWAKMSEHIHVTCIHAYLRASTGTIKYKHSQLCVCVAERGNDSGEFRPGWEMGGEGVSHLCRTPTETERDTKRNCPHSCCHSNNFQPCLRGGRPKGFPDSSPLSVSVLLCSDGLVSVGTKTLRNHLDWDSRVRETAFRRKKNCCCFTFFGLACTPMG